MEYQEIRRYLADIQFPKAIKRVELEVIKVGFSDGTAWNTHKIYKRDPKNLKGPLKGWTPVEADGTKPEVKKSSGSARNGTALFFAHSFDRHTEVSWKVKTDWLKPLTQTTECGQAVTVGLGGCANLEECFYDHATLSPIVFTDALQQA